MSSGAALHRLEQIIDASGIAPRIEMLLPVGVRPRQLKMRTLLIGMLLALSDGRPAHLRRVHEALLSLPEPDKWRLGVLASWKSGEHLLTYRQTERTSALVVRTLAKERPDGQPSQALRRVMDSLLEASVQVLSGATSSSLAVDWTDYESRFRPPRRRRSCGDEGQHSGDGSEDDHGDEDAGDERPSGQEQPRTDAPSADAEASWGRRHGQGQRDEPFFGYYLQAATVVKEERGGEVPELTRRILLTSCRVDPPRALVSVIERMAREGIELGDVLADCGYSYREPETWAMPLRALGAELICDIHPNDRAQKGSHQGAIASNGNLYCPATPKTLFELSAPAPTASEAQLQEHDRRCSELARYKLGPVSARDQDGYHRVACPAAAGKLRCPLRPSSMRLPFERPEVIDPPAHPPPCCTQQTITVPPSVNAKTAQKHDWPSRAHRRSYARRSGSERAFSTVKDPASNDISAKGWCRLAGITGPSLFLACLFCVRNVRVAEAFAARAAEDARRAARGRPPRRRRRRRHSSHDLMAAANAPPA